MSIKGSPNIDRLHEIIVEHCRRDGSIPTFDELAQHSGLGEAELAAVLALDFSIARALRWPDAKRQDFGEKIRSVYEEGNQTPASLPQVIADLELQQAHRHLKR